MLGRGLLDLDILVNLTVALDPAIVAVTAGASEDRRELQEDAERGGPVSNTC